MGGGASKSQEISACLAAASSEELQQAVSGLSSEDSQKLRTAVKAAAASNAATAHIISGKAAKEGGKTVLVISCSPMGGYSATNKVGKAFCEAYTEAFPDDGIRVLDLCGADAPPPFLAPRVQAKFKTFSAADGADADAEWQVTKKIVDDFKSADKYVFLCPMWNFHIPYTLKQYLDQIIQPHLTFALPDMKGQVSGKPALIVMASGVVPIGCPMDLGSPYLKAALGFIGFTDVRLFDVSGVVAGGNDMVAARSDEVKELAPKFSFDDAAKLEEATVPEVPEGTAAEVKAGAKVLLITASPMGDYSATGKACKGFMDALKAKDATVELTTLDLGDGKLEAFQACRVQAKFATWMGGKDAPLADDAAKKEWDYTMGLIDQFKAADVYVFAVPMWNFFLPYTLKQYIDHIMQPHQLFDPVNNTGLLEGKRAFVVAASGNGLLGTPMDHITPYMKLFLTMAGVSDASYTFVNGTATPDADKAIEGATESLKGLACL